MNTKEKPILNDVSRCRFIEVYKNYPVLWDKNHAQHKSYETRVQAYNEISQIMQIHELTPNKVVKIIHNMRSSYVKLKKQGLISAENQYNCKKWVIDLDAIIGQQMDNNLVPESPVIRKSDLPSDHALRMHVLDTYKDQEVLWNPQHSNNKVSFFRDQAWENCAERIGISVSRIRRQIHNMRTTYVKKRKLRITEPFSTDCNTNCWLKAIDSFLGPVLFETDKEGVARLKPQNERKIPLAESNKDTEEVEESLVEYSNEDYLDESIPGSFIEENVISQSESPAPTTFHLTTCRCCLKQNDEDHNKFLDYTFRDGIAYSQIYKDCIGYNRTDSPLKLSPAICSNCELTLLDLYEFRKQCRNSEEEYLTTMVAKDKKEVNIADQQESSVVNLKIERLEFENTGEVIEAEEEVDPIEEENIEEHNDDVYAEELSVEEPPAEEQTTVEENPPARHMQPTLGNMCPYCLKVFKKTRYLKRHVELSCTMHPNFDRNKLPVCPICGKQVSRLSVHLKTHTTSDSERFKCQLCPRSYKTKVYLDSHMKFTHLHHTYDCQFCHMKFKSWSGKRNHMRLKHLGVRPYACDVADCERAFSQLAQLNYHRSKVHFADQKTLFKCDECTAQFTKKETLKIHKEAKHSDNTVTCEVCKKVFAHKKMLRQHAILHTGEKNYKCRVCYISFAQNHILRTHMGKLHPEYPLPPKGTVMSERALRRMARQEEIDKTFIKIEAE